MGFDISLSIVFFYSEELVSSSCIGVYFEGRVELLGPPLSTSQTLRHLRI